MSSKKLLFFGICLIGLFILSCRPANQFSKKEIAILTKPYYSLAVPIDSINTLDDLLKYLNKTYCEQNQERWPIVYLNMKTHKLEATPNKNTILVGIDPNPCFEGKYVDNMILEIIKDNKNIIIENEYTEVDSIPSYVKKQMLSDGKDPNYAAGAYGNGIWICSKKNDKIKNLEPLIYQVVKGYIESVRIYSKKVFGKPIDKLTDSELQKIYSEFTFHLSFKYTDKDDVNIKVG